MKVYHYTSESNWNKIKEPNDCYEPNLAGLKPLGRFLSLDYNVPDEAYAGAIFALLEPEPREWISNKELWRTLMSQAIHLDNKIALLEIELTKNDKAYIVNRAIANNTFWKEGTSKELITTAANNYWNSRILINEYKNDYELPEVTIFNFIPINQISLKWIKHKKQLIL